MAFIDREIFGPAIDLPRPGMHDRDPGIDRPACFQELQLRRAVDREVVFGRRHRIEVAGLRRQVEKKILAGEQVWQRKSAADIGDIDDNPIADIGDIGEIAAIIRDHAVDEQYLGAERDETPGDRRADQAQPAGNDRPGTGVGLEAGGRASIPRSDADLVSPLAHPLPNRFAASPVRDRNNATSVPPIPHARLNVELARFCKKFTGVTYSSVNAR